MICPSCGHANLPGSDECTSCMFNLASLDRPEGHDRVEASVMSDPIELLRSRPPITILATATLGQAMQLMMGKEIGALLVVDEQDKLVGILTERDYLTKVVGLLPDYANQPIHTIMTHNPETVSSADTLAYALHKMDVGGYRHLPVVENGRAVGVISVRDVIKHITRLCKDS